MRNIINKIKNILQYLPLFLTGLLVACLVYIKTSFKLATFEQLLYSFIHSEGTNLESVLDGLLIGSIVFLLVCFILLIPTLNIYKNSTVLKIKTKKKEKNIQLIPLLNKTKFKFVVLGSS